MLFIYELCHDHVLVAANERFYGYAIDMMKEIAVILNITYKIHLAYDGITGRPLPNGSWTGMIGELISNVSATTYDLETRYHFIITTTIILNT